MTQTPAPRRWIVPSDPGPKALAALREFTPLVARILWQRGLHTPAAANEFMTIEWQQRHDPLLLRDMDRAVARIQQALAGNEQIVVYGDFDTDGVTAVTLLIQVFTALKAAVKPYIPLRENEGYGLNNDAVRKLHAEGANLLITVDCGISNADEIALASELGLDVIVIDHHQPPARLPEAVAVIDPKRADCPYPFKGLCGVGLAFKLFEALWQAGIRAEGLRARDILDVVALGTIADMMPLTGENRILVHYGLQALNMSQRPGIRALCRVATVEPGTITASSVGFRLAPRINAAGRLEDALLAYDLLLAPDNASAQRYAEQLNQTNVERQALMRAVQAEARAQVLDTQQHDERLMLIMGEQFHHGVVGLAAGRLADEFHRPVLVLGCEGDMCRGSARSISGFNIVEALTSCADILEKFGGHAAAAGLTVQKAHLPELHERLRQFANTHITPEMLVPHLTMDSAARLNEINAAVLEQIDQLAPFGQANPAPLLASFGVSVVEARGVGSDSSHLKLRLEQDGASFGGISFGNGALANQLQRGSRIDIAYRPEFNVWRDQRKIDLQIQDLKIAP